jgi:hypothetical protein
LYAEHMIRCFLILTIQYLSLRESNLVGFGGTGEFNMFSTDNDRATHSGKYGFKALC